MDDRIKQAMQNVGDYTPDQACQHVLECLESFLQEMDEVLPDKTAIQWAAILAKAIQPKPRKDDTEYQNSDDVYRRA